MDSFMDKIAQKFTAQDMIKANTAAEEKELKRLRMQVEEYDKRLEEMRKLNLKNLELVDKLQEMMEPGEKKTPEGQNQEIRDLQTALSAQTARMNELSEQIMDHVHKEDVKVYRNVQAAVADENKILLGELSKKQSDNKPVIILSAVTLVASLANVAFWVLRILGVL